MIFSRNNLVILTDDETERAAKALCESSLRVRWDNRSDDEKRGFREVVISLAAEVDVERSNAAVAAFMKWMGEFDRPRDHHRRYIR
jgi:hypothetical protein